MPLTCQPVIFTSRETTAKAVEDELQWGAARVCQPSHNRLQLFRTHAIVNFMEESHESPRSSGCCDWRKTIDDMTTQTEKFVREDPSKAMGIALFAGVLLTVLPVGRLISALVRLVFALARPVLLVFGAVKIYEECQRNRKP